MSRNILNPATRVAAYAGSVTTYAGSANFNVLGHGLRSGQKIFFTQPITVTVGTTTSNLISQTTKLVSSPYWVKVIDVNNFVVSNSLNNYTVSSFVAFPSTGIVGTYPSIFYTQVLGGGLTTISPIELLTLPMVRARKYEFDSSSIFNTALDATVQIQILLLLRELQREMGLSVIFVTHDIGAATEVADRIAVMYAGRIVEEGPARTLIREPRHPYTLALLKSRAHGALAKGSRLETIGGAPPDLGALPPGCSFAERCSFAQDACRSAAPEVVHLDAGHRARCVRTDATAAVHVALHRADHPAREPV